MEATYRRYHFRAQRGVAETQEEFEDRKATKLFAVRASMSLNLCISKLILSTEAIYHFVCKRSPNKQRRTHLIKLDDCIANLKPRRQTAYTLFRDDHPDKPAAQFGEDGRRSQIGQWNKVASQTFARLPPEEIQRLKDEAADINDNQSTVEPHNEWTTSEAVRAS